MGALDAGGDLMPDKARELSPARRGRISRRSSSIEAYMWNNPLAGAPPLPVIAGLR
jgi:hypothetical protein